MRFEAIRISNYRQYKDLNFEFTKVKDTDLHIIVASNGVGKTNLLNAINWCLYGEEPHMGGDAEDSLTICNLNAIDDAKKAGEKHCIVKVKIEATSNKSHYTFEREVTVNVDTYFVGIPSFKVSIIDGITGETSIIEETADETVNQFFPKTIRAYFFFDGEQLFNYFKPQKESTSFVKDAIHEVAQVSLLTSAKNHLERVIKIEYQDEIAKLNPKVQEITSQQRNLEKQLEEIQREIEDLETSVELSEQKVRENDEKINGTEAVVKDNQQYNKNLNELEKVNIKRKELKERFYKLIHTYVPLLYMYNVNVKTNKFICEKHEKGLLPPDINTDLLLQSLDDHICVFCKQSISSETEKTMRKLVDQIEISSEVSNKLSEIKNDVASYIDQARNYKKDKEVLMQEVKKLDSREKEIENENVELYKRIRVFSNIEGLESWINERDDHKALIKINNQKIGSYQEREKNVKSELERLARDLEKASMENEKSETLKSYMMFAKKSKSVIENIEGQMINKVRTEMENLTTKLFDGFIWRKHTYSRVALTENYKLVVYHAKTDKSCMSSCSAAERQMLALAFTIALHQVSGHDSLLFIDTPVGRVSDVNRENFAKVLVDVSKRKQMIFTFTPSEFSDEIKTYFNKDNVSSFIKLQSDEIETQKEA